MFKHLLTIAAAACISLSASAVEVEDFYKDYGAAAFGYYNMGYAPEFVAGEGWTFTAPAFPVDDVVTTVYKTDDEGNPVLDDEGNPIVEIEGNEDSHKEADGWYIGTDGKYHRDGVQWYQFFAADGLPTTAGTTYTLTFMIKADKESQFNLNFGNWDNEKTATLKVTTEWTAQSVTVECPTDGGFIVFQPGAQTTQFEMKWVTITHEDPSLDADLLCIKASGLSVKDETYSTQVDFNFDELPAGEYTISFDISGDVDGEIPMNPNGSWYWNNRCWPQVTAGKWTHYTKDVKFKSGEEGDGDNAPFKSLDFMLGKYEGSYVLFDNVVITRKGETENLVQNGNIAKATLRGWSKPGWHDHTISIANGPGHFVALPAATEGWATYCSDQPLKFKDEVEVYQATAINGDYLVLEQVDGVVPANTGVLYKADGAAHDILITVDEGEAFESNLLKPAFGGTTIAASDASAARYVFGVQNDVTGFFRLTQDATVPAGKNVAYLELTGPMSAPKVVVVEGDVTAIESISVDAEQGNNEIYNIQGIRVDRPTKGLYIVNGKKVVY